MHEVLEALGKIGIVPVIKIDDVEKAVPLARALIAGGLPCAEVTFRTAQGEEAIRRISREVPDILLGAGTVLTVEQVDRAINAGARFIVSPGFNPRVVAHCAERGIPVTPGCSNPSDIEQALEAGLEVVKFFPAATSGGPGAVAALAAPFGDMRFVPTGGIGLDSLASYLSLPSVVAVGGSWITPKVALNTGDWETVQQRARDTVAAAATITGTGENATGHRDTITSDTITPATITGKDMTKTSPTSAGNGA